ncbi:acetaldehyde dehydrogenase /alcohol dehydrogenase AdhE [Hydrogenoanaerobacterium saccharovorans]|uniref:Aldehyde-alcohol dehydrogenase n=1 Tax=Hydrogenoanaerobacterium saccharovorans TaxID=474960 RepID=A0A1H7YNY5_9FIRM|nr:bifunctional acetaldehyde-CoA/alcohol dehydrogenase [Hydrogenoanaerobacterium saccharovorans]RPF49114.1 acetaldehyde dehydrogenase /alcohol dehydrogenase AdhE [Hydrogenoanaerobacterium saccharovorans]SEM47564.1 acetaldehyde dehydrogenase /alcohol dehydrogenase AdhE [Hydrogenoanaerobacterium saccharovorans]
MAEKKVQAPIEKPVETKEMIDTLVAKANVALHEYMQLDQKQVDNIVHEMSLAGLDAHELLAKMAVEETGRGVYEDKVIKNMFATEYIWHSIKHQQTVGVVDENEMEGYVEVAEPVGVICGVTPTTNPTSTTLFKSIIAAKTRNPIIFGFHPSAQKCSAEAARIVYEVAVKAGAPKDCIQWIEFPSIEATNLLMNHPGVATILATGGPGMVKAAYSAGKPALGVGPGNVPCYIEKTADIERACTDLMMSKTFDNGMICASEQAVIVDKELKDKFEAYMKANNCYFLNKEETEKVSNYVINKDKMAVNAAVVGKSAYWIAEQAGVKVPEKTKILIAPLPQPSLDYPLSLEKLSPVLAYFISNSTEQGFAYAAKMLELGGLGHSAVIHTSDNALAEKYGTEMKVGRVIVNSPSSQGAIGDIYNTNTPSLTLGCGSYGKNSVSQNVSTINLVNKKRIAKRRVNMQWFKIPPKIYFEEDSIQYLEKMPDISRAFIVTDPMMVKLGNVDKILYYLRKRKEYCHSEIYSDVEPDPSVECIMRGVDAMDAFQPDVIIAIGGGSAIDAAKGMWLFYEHPDTSFDGLRLRFLDIRKRTFQFPKLGKRTQLVAIPTTSGTGSEVTSFSVITDKQNGNIKYPLADYELTPDVAIIDPQFCMSMPKSITADTGLDVLTHAIEAYVSVMASDYTDGLAIKAIELVFENLRRAYNNGSEDREAREKMHNASAIAGMAFTNAFLGLNHSMAHKLGGEYHIPHGRANAILLPYVIEYNAQKPTKFASFPKYKKFVADERYAKISRYLGLPAKTTEEGVASLVKAIRELMKDLDRPTSIKECGVDEAVFNSKLEELSYKAFEDQCTTANPRYPLVSEIQEIYKKAYYGEAK